MCETGKKLPPVRQGLGTGEPGDEKPEEEEKSAALGGARLADSVLATLCPCFLSPLARFLTHLDAFTFTATSHSDSQIHQISDVGTYLMLASVAAPPGLW